MNPDVNYSLTLTKPYPSSCLAHVSTALARKDVSLFPNSLAEHVLTAFVFGSFSVMESGAVCVQAAKRKRAKANLSRKLSICTTNFSRDNLSLSHSSALTMYEKR